MHTLYIALGGALILVIYRIVSGRDARKRIAVESEKMGCKPPPMMRQKDPLGITRLYELAKANREGRNPQWFQGIMDEVGKDCHTIRGSLLGDDVIITRDPENTKAIFGTQSADFLITKTRREVWWPLLGRGIFTNEGEEWKHSRALMRPNFSREQVSDLDLENKHVQVLLNLEDLRAGPDGWTEHVDLSPLFLNLTLDTATEFLYGVSAESQVKNSAVALRKNKDSKIPRDDFGAHLDGGKEAIYVRALFGRFHRLLPSGEYKRHCRELARQVDVYIDETLARKKSGKIESGHEKTFLEELMKYTQDRYELRSETLNVLNAGRDTTGAAVGWMFYFVSRSPRVFNKLRAIILEEFGASHKEEIEFQKLRNCQYLQHVMNEAMRLAAVVSLNERVAVRDTTLPRGGGPDGSQPIFIHKGLRVMVSKWAMQHRADIWGADVEEFTPERWETRRAGTGWEFIPFGGGPRKCIGQQFALTEASFILVRFLQRFDRIDNVEPLGPPKYKVTVSNRSMTGVQVRMHQAAPV